MAKNLGFAKRLGEQLREMGYWPEGRHLPNYTLFGIEKGFVPSAVYRWLHGEIPRADTFYRLCLATKEQAHWYLLGERVPEPTPGSSISDYIEVLAKHTRGKAKKSKKTKRRKALPIRGGSCAENPLPVARPRILKENTTKHGVTIRKDEILCQVRGLTMARLLLLHAPAVVNGAHRRAA